jgi:hypothetical protein
MAILSTLIDANILALPITRIFTLQSFLLLPLSKWDLCHLVSPSALEPTESASCTACLHPLFSPIHGNRWLSPGISKHHNPNQYAGPGDNLAAYLISQRATQAQSSMNATKHSHNIVGSNLYNGPGFALTAERCLTTLLLYWQALLVALAPSAIA